MKNSEQYRSPYKSVFLESDFLEPVFLGLVTITSSVSSPSVEEGKRPPFLATSCNSCLVSASKRCLSLFFISILASRYASLAASCRSRLDKLSLSFIKCSRALSLYLNMPKNKSKESPAVMSATSQRAAYSLEITGVGGNICLSDNNRPVKCATNSASATEASCCSAVISTSWHRASSKICMNFSHRRTLEIRTFSYTMGRPSQEEVVSILSFAGDDAGIPIMGCVDKISISGWFPKALRRTDLGWFLSTQVSTMSFPLKSKVGRLDTVSSN
mmetsp:Transcript_26018/g.54299  ORF Transcript_26018/g.54299 Transcript_26018/m.54299 type:complete len:272 (+) Transcript_26018:179-994(+)